MYARKMGVDLYDCDTMKAFYRGYGDAFFDELREKLDTHQWNHTYVDDPKGDLSGIKMFNAKIGPRNFTFSNGLIFNMDHLAIIPAGSALRDILCGMCLPISYLYIHKYP